MIKIDTPVFTKREPRPYDYQEMTWGKFIKLREWAKKTSKELGYSIYLVGSTLKKEVPRDFDIVMTIPEQEFEEMFGELTEENFGETLVKSWHKFAVPHYFNCVETLGECGHTPLDFKVYPDNWFVDEDKLLLGSPNTIEKLPKYEKSLEEIQYVLEYQKSFEKIFEITEKALK